METQYAEAKEELLGELKGKTTSITVKDFTPTGARLEYNFQGEIKGRINGRAISTVTVLFKPDGTSEYETRAIYASSEGDTILVTSNGHSRRENPTTSRLEGKDTYQTLSKRLAWLNDTKGRQEGTYNPVTGEGLLKLYGKA
jgi:hypothetical protein